LQSTIPNPKLVLGRSATGIKELEQGIMQRLWIHAGMPKTGSTFLQKLFNSNSKALDKGRLHYMRTGRGKRNAHREMTRVLGIKSPKDKPVSSLEAFLEKFAREAAKHPKCDLLVSYEVFSRIAPPTDPTVLGQRLRKLAERYELNFVFYVRRLDQWLESMHNQFYRNGTVAVDLEVFARDPGRYLNGFEHDYRKLLEFYADIAGREHVHVRAFIPRLFEGGSLESDMLATLGKKIDDLVIPERQAESVDSSTMAALRDYYSALGPERSPSGANVSKISSVLQTRANLEKRPKLHLSTLARHAVIDAKRDSIEWMLQNWLPNVDPNLFLNVDGPDPDERAVAPLSDADFRRATWTLIDALHSQFRRLASHVQLNAADDEADEDDE
jgi:hypothetical protein